MTYRLPALIGTGDRKEACCHLLSVSFVKVTDASLVPSGPHSEPTCVPLFSFVFQKRTPVTLPSTLLVKAVPSSTDARSASTTGVAVGASPQIVTALVFGRGAGEDAAAMPGMATARATAPTARTVRRARSDVSRFERRRRLRRDEGVEGPLGDVVM